MHDTEPTIEMLAIWAAEQVWDWRVRVMFAIVCAVAVALAIVVYLVCGRTGENDGRVRRYFGRICVTMLVIAVAESAFFKEPLSTALLVATAAVIGFIGLRMPSGRAREASGDVPDEIADPAVKGGNRDGIEDPA